MKTLFLLLALVSCSSLPFPNEKIKENTCYVQWKTPSNRELYQKSLGKSKDQIITEGLQMPTGENGGIYVRSKISSSLYAVIFDYSDANATQLVDRINETHFLEIDPRLKAALMESTFKISRSELAKMLARYEEVSCGDYMMTQVPSR